jgi:hypothetical protein
MNLDPAKVFTEIKALPTAQGLNVARGLLAVFLPFGLNEGIDRVCSEKLSIPTSDQPVTIGRPKYVRSSLLILTIVTVNLFSWSTRLAMQCGIRLPRKQAFGSS